jgi:O-methyltransferase involved in polyketide biosynthesis
MGFKATAMYTHHVWHRLKLLEPGLYVRSSRVWYWFLRPFVRIVEGQTGVKLDELLKRRHLAYDRTCKEWLGQLSRQGQIVELAAGFSGRFARMGTEPSKEGTEPFGSVPIFEGSVPIFEFDLPDTSRAKQKLVGRWQGIKGRNAPTFVPCNLTDPAEFKNALGQIDHTMPTLFIMEGLIPYLNEEEFERFVRSLITCTRDLPRPSLFTAEFYIFGEEEIYQSVASRLKQAMRRILRLNLYFPYKNPEELKSRLERLGFSAVDVKPLESSQGQRPILYLATCSLGE